MSEILYHVTYPSSIPYLEGTTSLQRAILCLIPMISILWFLPVWNLYVLMLWGEGGGSGCAGFNGGLVLVGLTPATL